MKISISCITYNHEKFIAKTMDGFLMQKFSGPWEIIISDDASTDKTPDILRQYQKKYPDKIRLLLNEKNIGMMANFIQSLKASKAEYTAVCEGDDYWTDPHKLKKQVSFLSANPDYSFCAHRVMYQFGKKLNRSYHWDAPEISDLQYLLRKGNYFSTLSVVFRNDPRITDFIGLFPQAPLGDYLLYVGAARLGKLRILDDVMGVYRIHKGGIWSQTGFEKVFDKLLHVLEMLFEKLGNEYHNDLRIQLIRMLENRIWLDEKFMISDNTRLKGLLGKMNIPEYVTEYINFSIPERKKPSYYSKHVPVSLLYEALKQKVKGRYFRR